MIAIIRDGGKQYRVEEGQTLYLDHKDSAPGDQIEFGDVLSIEDGAEIRVGQPTVEGAKVLAEVVGAVKSPKLIFHRFRRRKGSRTRFGHRQEVTQVRITKIEA